MELMHCLPNLGRMSPPVSTMTVSPQSPCCVHLLPSFLKQVWSSCANETHTLPRAASLTATSSTPTYLPVLLIIHSSLSLYVYSSGKYSFSTLLAPPRQQRASNSCAPHHAALGGMSLHHAAAWALCEASPWPCASACKQRPPGPRRWTHGRAGPTTSTTTTSSAWVPHVVARTTDRQRGPPTIAAMGLVSQPSPCRYSRPRPRTTRSLPRTACFGKVGVGSSTTAPSTCSGWWGGGVLHSRECEQKAR